MTNSSIIILLSLLAVMVTITTVISYFYTTMRNTNHLFHLLSFCVLGWLINDILFFASNDTDLILYFNTTKFLFVAFTPVFLLIFVFRFYRMNKYLTPSILSVLIVVPTITSALALIPSLQFLLRSHAAVMQISPVTLVSNTQGFWFWINAAYSYLLLIICACVLLSKYQSLPKGHHLPSMIMMVAIVVALVTNWISLMPAFFLPFDLTVVGMSISLIFIYAASASSVTSEFLILAREEIFNYLEESLFI
ncbi:MAG: histidine kinase N-terminal 7TM domain-containing protein, partial [Oscillospiraceae bacterium]